MIMNASRSDFSPIAATGHLLTLGVHVEGPSVTAPCRRASGAGRAAKARWSGGPLSNVRLRRFHEFEASEKLCRRFGNVYRDLGKFCQDLGRTSQGLGK